jgi:hypothetical protein
MTDYLRIRLELLATTAGGRSSSAILKPEADARYLPHFRVGQAGEYLGVAFVDGAPQTLAPGQSGEATVALIYGDTGVDYSALLPGVTFNLMEGSAVVGSGTVLQRWQEDSDWRSRPGGNVGGVKG